MNDNKLVSVIIPMYNSIRFLSTAVDSVLKQEFLGEILLVDDGSNDGTFELALEMEKKHINLVKVLSHPNRMNRGAAESRNLGIINAKYEYISFLDSDDFYLPSRFVNAIKIFSENKEADGVYEAIGTHAYDVESYEVHLKRINDCKVEGLDPELTTLTKVLDPEELFSALVFGRFGWFHFNGLTLKKKSLEKSGLIRGDLNRFGEDNEFFLRLSTKLKLFPGDLKNPVAKRGVYHDNVTLSTFRNDYISLMTAIGNVQVHKFIFLEILNSNRPKNLNRFALMRYLDNYSIRFLKLKPGLYRKIVKLFNMYITLMNNPELIRRIV